jgi:hypothetical protein
MVDLAFSKQVGFTLRRGEDLDAKQRRVYQNPVFEPGGGCQKDHVRNAHLVTPEKGKLLYNVPLPALIEQLEELLKPSFHPHVLDGSHGFGGQLSRDQFTFRFIVATQIFGYGRMGNGGHEERSRFIIAGFG